MIYKAFRGVAVFLVAVILCMGTPPLQAPDGGAAKALTQEKLRHLERLRPSEYLHDTYLPGEVVVVLKRPSLEDLGRLIGDFAAVLEADPRSTLSFFAASPAKRAVRLRLREGVEELAAARALTTSSLVKTAEPNIVFRTASTTPDDPLYGQQWNLSGAYGVRADRAWDLQRGSESLTLAVIDTGMDYYHEDLAGRRAGGWDYFNGGPDPRDDNGHGTMVAGIACANTNNGKGLAGLDWNARIMPLKALGADGEGYLDGVVNSIYHAAGWGADVINMSLTSPTYSQSLADAVEFAHSKGCFMVAAAGNDGDARIAYPAGLTYVKGVGSIGREGSRSWFSNYNSTVDLVAPGERVVGPKPGNMYSLASGTSEAAPHVSAAALLVMAEYPGSTADEVWRRLRDSARDLGSPGYDESYGWGLLDVYGALKVPLVSVDNPREHDYPVAGKVSVTAFSPNAAVKELELWLGSDLIESHRLLVPSTNVSHTFVSWDLASLDEGTHEITVRAVDSSGAWAGEHAITVYRNLSQPRPASDWYLAEGTTAWGFEEYVLVQNPNAAPAAVNLTFMKPDGSVQEHYYSMAASSRLTVFVNSLVSGEDVSTHVHADLPVIAERAMYWGNRRDGHTAVGANSPNRDWYLAEGTTAWGFEEYVLVQNPNAAPATLLVTFMKPGGSTVEHGFTMPGYSRHTLAVNDLVPSSDISTHVHADLPVVAERAMYWGGREGGHATLGVTTGCKTWYLAEGTTAWGFETYVLVQNPNAAPATVFFTFMRPDGSQVPYVRTVAPMSRSTLNVAEVVPGSDVSTFVRADQPVIAERAMYWQRGPRARAGGHCSTGSMTAARTWYLAEGTTAWGFQEYVLLANPTEYLAHATLIFMRTDGSTLDHRVDVPANTRVTVHANRVDAGRDASIKVISDIPLVVERSMYWADKEGGTNSLGVMQP